MVQPAPERVEALDLIRGVAVLGILAINMAGFAGPPAATLSPHLPQAGSRADEFAYAFGFVLFEGKMRALFSLLFGASMALFLDRAEARRRNAAALQARRLGWLMLFGLLHFHLLWWGDILFAYALAGVLALAVRREPVRALAVAALLLFASWHLIGTALSLPAVVAEEQVRLGTATDAEATASARYLRAVEEQASRDTWQAQLGFAERARDQVRNHALEPLEDALWSLAETLPLMLIGMALYRTGFFDGRWSRKRLRQIAIGGTGAGLAATLGLLAWLWPRDFPVQAMTAALLYWTALPHLAIALGYAALLVLWAPAIGRTGLGRRLVAAGRMALSNYVGTSIVMTALFYGWGLGLFGTVGHAAGWAFVLLGWMLMLAWSAPWLARFRQGPLEWLWRSLTEWRMLRIIR